MEFEVSQSFVFDGAHHLTSEHREHYGDLHGHSWTCTVTVTGIKSEKKQWVIDFEQFEEALRKTAFLLDHKYHNEIEGLETPTMENMSVWIAEAVWSFLVTKRLDSKKIAVTKVELQRATLGEKVTYRPTNLALRPKQQAAPSLDIDFGAKFKKGKVGTLYQRVQKIRAEAAKLEKRIVKYKGKMK